MQRLIIFTVACALGVAAHDVDGGPYAATTIAPGGTTMTPSNGCCPSMQAQVNDLISQVSYLMSHSQEQDDEISQLEDEVVSLQQELDQLQSSLSLDEEERSCTDIHNSGEEVSGMYTIDPDGANGYIVPFQVYCDFTTDSPTTLIGHDSENRTLVNGCQDPGCFSQNITYDISMQQILSVITNSETCKQYVKYECFASMMFSYYDYAWWASRKGVNQYYWGGAPPGSKLCACGAQGTCEGDSTTCNCDNNDEVWREDDGYLTGRDVLPVSQLNFGDVYGEAEKGYFTLGKLECQGTAKEKDCAELKRAGKPSGYYEIDPDPFTILDPITVYCDMDSYPGTGITAITHNATGKTGPLYDYNGVGLVNVDYVNVTMDAIVSLINISSHCQQYIEWECYRTGMLGITDTYWQSREGEKMNYWGGAYPGHEDYCACGESGTCQPNGNASRKCNCDALDISIRVDGGFLDDKSKLPVTAMHFDFYYGDYNGYYGYYTLGDLECY